MKIMDASLNPWGNYLLHISQNFYSLCDKQHFWFIKKKIKYDPSRNLSLHPACNRIYLFLSLFLFLEIKYFYHTFFFYLRSFHLNIQIAYNCLL